MKETDLSLVVGTDEADHDYITLLSLETIHGMNRNELPERFEEGIPFNKFSGNSLRFIPWMVSKDKSVM